MGGPQRNIDQKLRQIKRKSVCDSFTAWLWANSHWPCFDSETINDMGEASSCPHLRKHMIRCPYLIQLHLPGLERAQHKTAVRVKRTNVQGGRHPFSRPGHTNLEASSFKIPRSIIFYSEVDSNYCLFPQAE